MSSFYRSKVTTNVRSQKHNQVAYPRIISLSGTMACSVMWNEDLDLVEDLVKSRSRIWRIGLFWLLAYIPFASMLYIFSGRIMWATLSVNSLVIRLNSGWYRMNEWMNECISENSRHEWENVGYLMVYSSIDIKPGMKPNSMPPRQCDMARATLLAAWSPLLQFME